MLRSRPLLCLLLVAAFVAGGCTSRELVSIPKPPKIDATTTSTVVDFSAVNLSRVPGRATTTLAIGPGGATLGGAVAGPDGPVDAATVRAERIVGDGVVGVDVTTRPDGTWTIPAVLGGRYRVRAWKAPELALTAPEVFFLGNTENKVVNVALTRYTGFAVSGAVSPDPPPVDDPVNLAVQLTERSVDAQGIVHGTPVAAVNLELFGSGDWQVQTANPSLSDTAGVARFRMVCRRAGQQPLSVVVGDSRSFALDIAPCAVPPPDPNAVELEPSSTTSTTARASTTSTTRPTTTSTTRPPSTTTSTTRP